MAPSLFRILLVAVTLYALLKGGRDERQVAGICVLGTLVTYLVISPLSQRFESIEGEVLAVDLAVFAGFLAVALRSNRFWPLWIAGLQLTTTLGHMMKRIDADLIPKAYGASLNFWAYPILIILAVGTWRGHRRRLQAEQASPA